MSGLPGVFEHIYTLSTILQDSTTYKKPLMMMFLDLKNAFGSVSHRLIFDMLNIVKVPNFFSCYVESFYSLLLVVISTKNWETEPIPFQRGVFQGDTQSPIIFLLAFNPLLKLAKPLNVTHGYRIQLPIEGCDDLPPIDSFVYVKWSGSSDEPPGWYRARIDQYFLEETCKIIYDDRDENIVYEVVDLRKVEWKPCSKRARKYVSFQDTPAVRKTNWKQSPKFAPLLEHSLKGYADDVTLISTDLTIHTSVLQSINKKAADLDLSFKPVKCVSYLFDGLKIIPQGISLSKGATRSIVEGETKFLGKIIDVSISVTKKVAGARVKARLTSLLSATDSLQIRGEYKLWIYRNYIILLLRFTLCVDSVSVSTISQLESTATRYLKKWLNLPRSASRVLLYYPGICCPSIMQVSREAKLNLLSCVSASSDSRLQERITVTTWKRCFTNT